MLLSALIVIQSIFSGFTGISDQWTLDESRSTMKVTGTSTMHDWEMTVENMNGSASISAETIESLSLTVPAKSLKSGKGAMDKNAYKALKVDDHPNMKFSLISVEAEGDNYKVRGKLSIAGETRIINIPAKLSFSDNALNLKGETSFKMSAFDVEPPSFMMGTVTTGDQITVHFNIYYQNHK